MWGWESVKELFSSLHFIWFYMLRGCELHPKHSQHARLRIDNTLWQVVLSMLIKGELH